MSKTIIDENRMRRAEMDAMKNDPGYESATRFKNVINLAKKFHNSQTEVNRTQFIFEFNQMTERDQEKAVQMGSELSNILIGWCAATRLELLDEKF